MKYYGMRKLDFLQFRLTVLGHANIDYREETEYNIRLSTKQADGAICVLPHYTKQLEDGTWETLPEYKRAKK